MKLEWKDRKIFKLDPFILIPSVILLGIGIITLLSTTIEPTGGFGDLDIVKKQIIFSVIGLIGYFMLSFIDFSWMKNWQLVLPIYVATVGLLIAVLLWGPVINNVRRWLPMFGIQLQISELAKIAVILVTASIFSFKDKYNQWILLLVSLAFVIPIVILIYLQPSGSMSILTLAIWFIVAFTGLNNQLRNTICLLIVFSFVSVFLFISVTGNWLFTLSGVFGLILSIFAYNYKGNWQRIVIGSVLIGILLGSVSTLIYSNVLRDYQKNRIVAYFNPTETSGDIGFNVNQARIAIGSGQIFGKGFGNGTQSKRDFLPEHQTDFIFASFAEEFGLVGSLFLLAMYGVIISKGLILSVDSSKDGFFSMIIIGITLKILFEIFINMGTNMGIIPATGIPLPLVSAGGSITLMTLFSLGIIQSIINSPSEQKNISKIIDNY